MPFKNLEGTFSYVVKLQVLKLLVCLCKAKISCSRFWKNLPSDIFFN